MKMTSTTVMTIFQNKLTFKMPGPVKIVCRIWGTKENIMIQNPQYFKHLNHPQIMHLSTSHSRPQVLFFFQKT